MAARRRCGDGAPDDRRGRPRRVAARHARRLGGRGAQVQTTRRHPADSHARSGRSRPASLHLSVPRRILAHADASPPTRRRVGAARPSRPPAPSPAPVTSLSDSALLDRFLRDSDDAALAVLVARVAPTVYRLARALTAWRVIGAQTVAERSWRAALARAGEVHGDDALSRVRRGEGGRRAAAAG